MKELGIRWGIYALSAACVVAMGIYVSQLIWLMFSGVEKPPLSFKHTQAVESGVNSAEPVDVATLVNWNLFGTPAVQQVVTQQPVEAPKTTLKLELLGVFLGRNGALSTAIIGEIGKSPDYFKEGDTIARGVELKEVYADKVILNRDGRFETLAFAESQGSNAGASSAANDASAAQPNFSAARRNFLRRSTSTEAGPASDGALPQSQLGRMVQSGKVYAPSKIVDALTQDLNQNPQAALQEMGLRADGNGVGYVIGSNAPTDLLRTMGLRVGDRVLSVDGQAISGGPTDAGLIQSAMQKSNVQVSIQRGTRTFTVNVVVPK